MWSADRADDVLEALLIRYHGYKVTLSINRLNKLIIARTNRLIIVSADYIRTAEYFNL